MDSTFLGQGSYGCVYKKKLKCLDGEKLLVSPRIRSGALTKLQNNEVLSKIFINKKYATREIEIGKEIVKISNYENYYSPVLKNCNVSLGQIKSEDIEKCTLIDVATTESYFTTMTKYVKGQTLNKYLIEYKKTNQKYTIDNKIIYIHTCLMKSIDNLISHGIIHFDLSEANIIMDVTDRPIMIDFGMSIKTENIKTEEEFKYEFGHYSAFVDSTSKKLELYEPWCVEIIILLYLNQMEPTTINKEHIEEMKSLSDEYINLLKMENNYFTQNEIDKYKSSKHNLYEKMKGETTLEASKELLKTSINWDKYAVTITCLKYLSQENKLEKINQMKEIILV